MLTELHVKNLALIDEAEVPFGPGLNILTGETGAGKSILIGSINLALGQKMSREMLRKGKDSCLVELVFQVENPAVRKKLADLDVETEDGQLVITRKITGGRSLCRLNGETCTVAKIRQISSLLLDIHGQHEHQKLLYPENQLEILDSYGGNSIRELLDRVAEAYSAWQAVRTDLKDYQIDEKERGREISFLKFEIEEIEKAALVPGEEEELEKKYRRMANSRKIAEALNTVRQLMDDDGGAADRIGRAAQEVAAVTSYDEEGLGSLQHSIADIDSLVGDFDRELSGYLDSFSFSEEEFYETERRLDEINGLKARYGRTVEDVLHYLEEQKKKLARMEHFDQQKAELEEQLAERESELERAAQALSNARKKTAENFAAEVRKELAELNFLSTEFEVSFARTPSYNKNGFDAVEFRISTNPGEPLNPLNKVVSGGELSRIMLAIKTILADKDETETLIFDEIDTGISGRTAQKVSEKMARIARKRQVICITHLAQIAAMADHHFMITKGVENQETISRIRELSDDESVEELARILGGAEITQAVIDNAREMKTLAEERKKEL